MRSAGQPGFQTMAAAQVMQRASRPRFMQFAAGLLVVLSIDRAGAAGSHGEHHAGHVLGKVDFPVSCPAQAQVEFNQAVALLHHMTYLQAREAFEQVASTDPHCAMAHWGVAMTLFQPVWPTRPRPETLLEARN